MSLSIKNGSFFKKITKVTFNLIFIFGEILGSKSHAEPLVNLGVNAAQTQDKLIASCYIDSDSPSAFFSNKSFPSTTKFFSDLGTMSSICRIWIKSPIDSIRYKDYVQSNVAERIRAKPLQAALADRAVDLVEMSFGKRSDSLKLGRKSSLSKADSEKFNSLLKGRFNEGDVEFLYGPLLSYGSGTVFDSDAYVKFIKKSKALAIQAAIQTSSIGLCLSSKQAYESESRDSIGLTEIHNRYVSLYPTMDTALREQKTYIELLRNYLLDLARVVAKDNIEKDKMMHIIDSIAYSHFIGLDAPGVKTCKWKEGDYLSWYSGYKKSDTLLKMTGFDLASKSRTCTENFNFNALVETFANKKEEDDSLSLSKIKNTFLSNLGVGVFQKNVNSPVKDEAMIEDYVVFGVDGLEKFLELRFKKWLEGSYGAENKIQIPSNKISPSGTNEEKSNAGARLFVSDWTLPKSPCLNETLFQIQNSEYCETIRKQNSLPLTSSSDFIELALLELLKSRNIYSTLLLQVVQEDLKADVFRNKTSIGFACPKTYEKDSLDRLETLRLNVEDLLIVDTNDLGLDVEVQLNKMELYNQASNQHDFNGMFDYGQKLKDASSRIDAQRLKNKKVNSELKVK